MAMRTQIHRTARNATNGKHTEKLFLLFSHIAIFNARRAHKGGDSGDHHHHGSSSNMRAKCFTSTRFCTSVENFQQDSGVVVAVAANESKQTDTRKKQMKMQRQKEVGDLALNKSNCSQAIHIGSVFPSSAQFLSSPATIIFRKSI